MVTWVGWWCLYKRGSSPGLDPTFDRGLAEAADKSEASTKTLHTARSAAREGSSPVVQWTPPRSMTHPRSSASSLQGHNRTMTDWGRAAKGKGDVSDRGTRQGGPSRAGLWTEPDRTGPSPFVRAARSRQASTSVSLRSVGGKSTRTVNHGIRCGFTTHVHVHTSNQ